MRKTFNGIWDAERVLQNYLAFADDKGFLINTSFSRPQIIKRHRLLAALEAYGRPIGGFINANKQETIDVWEHFVSKTRSKEKMDRLFELIKANADKHFVRQLTNFQNRLYREEDILVSFKKLFAFRKKLYDVKHLWEGVLEGGAFMVMTYQTTKSLYDRHIKVVCDIIDEMLILLMGDDYDKTFTEKELFQYGYPDVTDEELEEMELDW